MVGIPHTGLTVDTEEFTQSARTICISTTDYMDKYIQENSALPPFLVFQISTRRVNIQTALEHRCTRPQCMIVVRAIGGMLPTVTDSESV